MDDQKLKEEAVRWLGSLRESAEQAKGFVLDQAPDAIRDLVWVGRLESAVWIIVWLALTATFGHLCVRSNRAAFRLPDDGHEDDGLTWFEMSLICALVAAFGFISLAFQIHPFLTSWFGPRVYVIETLAGLAGKVAGK